MNTLMITGGAGFIGSCFVRHAVEHRSTRIVNLDKLTYAGNLDSLPPESAAHVFVQGDIGDTQLVSRLLRDYRPDAVLHFAAESHVDRSIDGPAEFVQTNVVGTCSLLHAVLNYWQNELNATPGFRFLQVSTDEVYGSLGPSGQFYEETPYAPNSPYSASKAAADHFVRAYHHTYGLPTLTTNCSNNYGPYQFPEKLIPLMTLNALAEKPLPVYGDGGNTRDWLFVEDHCAAIRTVLKQGAPGNVYNVGGNCERTNLQIVKQICQIIDRLAPSSNGPRERLIQFVQDRPGHDRRYAVDTRRIARELTWQPAQAFEQGLEQTVRWYLENSQWLERISSGAYRQRQGLGALTSENEPDATREADSRSVS